MPRGLRLALAAGKAWNADNAFKHSAAVSFYTVFSLAPITVIAISVAGFFFGEEIATRQFSSQVTQLVGQSSAELVLKTMEATAIKQRSWFSSALGLVVLAIGATTVFAQLQQSLNDLWGVATKPEKRAWIVIIVKRLISFAMVLTVAFLLITSLILTTALTAMIEVAKGWVTVSAWVLRAADLTVGLGIITILFALMFKVLPDVRIRWREAWTGAFVTALLFTIGRFGIALYLGHSAITTTYGAAGSLVALLVWIYYSCAILFYGVELVRAHHVSRGLPIVPKEAAVLVRREFVTDVPKEFPETKSAP